MANKIDSNLTALYYAEEESIKTLPTTPVWYELEPNSYSDFGGEISTVARTPINKSRQRQKGTIVDLDASSGFNEDFTQTNMQRLLQGFCFADAREKPGTANFNDTAVTITGVTNADSTYAAASGLDVFLANHLVFASGFTESGNNGLKTVSSAAAAALVVAETLTDETPGSDAKIEVVGYQATSGDLDIDSESAYVALTSTTLDFTTLDLNVGEWIFIGGDTTATKFASNDPGYARISAIEANTLTFDATTFTATDETGTGLTIQLFFGRVIRNEDTPSLITRRSYQLERQLGEDDDGTQSEYVTGAIANEFTVNVAEADKLNVDLTFIALDNEQRTGSEGIKTGTRVSAEGESAYNTSTDVYELRLYQTSDSTINPSALLAYVSEATIEINNNVTANKAIAVLGGFDATAGDFEVGGSITAYFATVSAVAAVRNNASVGFNMICAQENTGFVFDIPLLTLGDGRLNVEKDSPITIPLDTTAAECDNGYTLLTSFFAYLPNAAMPA